MDRHDAPTVERADVELYRRRDRSPRRFRLVPPAITPIRFADVGAGLLGHLRGQGRDKFRQQMESYLDANGSGTYTSFRRTLAACFRELADADDQSRTQVLIPAFCSPDYPAVIDGVDLDPVRVDIDPKTLKYDQEALDAALDENTLAVVSINVLGYGSPVSQLASRCADQGAYLVESLGYALGTTFEDARLGTFGDCVLLNFQQGKPIPVGGGMVLTRDTDLAFSDEGRSQISANIGAIAGYAALSHPRPYYAFTRVSPHLEGLGNLSDRATTHPGSMTGKSPTPPFSTISDFQGTIAQRVFDRLDRHRNHRERTALFYTQALEDCPQVSRVVPIEGLSNLQHVRFPLVAESESLRDRIESALEDVGIQTKELYEWPVLDRDAFPGARRLQRTLLTLPTHPYVDDRDRRLIVRTIQEVVSTATRSGPSS